MPRHQGPGELPAARHAGGAEVGGADADGTPKRSLAPLEEVWERAVS
jgi:hypothetical protein